MKITGIQTMLLKGPRPHSVGGKAGEATRLIVRVDSDAGIYGLGEAQDFMGVRQAIDYIREILTGRSPFDAAPLCSELIYCTLPPHPPESRYEGRKFASQYQPLALCSPTATPSGPIVWGASAAEMALCDLAGKALQTPVYNLLGGNYRDRVEIYLDRSAPADADHPDAWKRMAEATVAEGFRRLKFDAEYVAASLTRDVWNRSMTTGQRRRIFERLEAVRKTVGWDVEIALDGHMHYTATEALELARELAPLKLMWFEDPTPIANPDACAEVRARSPIPICVGEMFTAEQARLFIDRGACDVIHPDVLFCGGLREAHRIAGYAELHYLPLALHGNSGSLGTIAAAHVAAASRNFLGLEYHFIEAGWINRFARREGVELFEDGFLRLTDAPGLGVALDEEICRPHLMPGESWIG